MLVQSAIAAATSAAPTVTLPSAPRAGELIIWAASIGAGNTPVVPAGFTTLLGPSSTTTPDTQGFVVGYKFAGNAETGTYTGSASGSDLVVCMACVLTGRLAGPPQATLVTNQTANASPYSATATGITALEGDDLVSIVHWIRNASGGGSDTVAKPTGFFDQQQLPNSWMGIDLAVKPGVAAGATGAVTSTVTLTGAATGGGYDAVLIAWPCAPGKRVGGVPRPPSYRARVRRRK